MIFGNAEQQSVQAIPTQGKIVEEDFEAEFEKIAHDNDDIVDDKLLDESFNVTLIDLNNNNDELVECFDKELSPKLDVAKKSDDNNNSLTATDLSKPECQTNRMINRKSKPSTSNSSKSGGSLKSDSCSPSTSSSQPLPLKAQCFLLACVYCIMMYLQFMLFNFKPT
jgi:hypothetical protein